MLPSGWQSRVVKRACEQTGFDRALPMNTGAEAVETALNTVSTDDAYVNGHVTFVAPRVSSKTRFPPTNAPIYSLS